MPAGGRFNSYWNINRPRGSSCHSKNWTQNRRKLIDSTFDCKILMTESRVARERTEQDNHFLTIEISVNFLEGLLKPDNSLFYWFCVFCDASRCFCVVPLWPLEERKEPPNWTSIRATFIVHRSFDKSFNIFLRPIELGVWSVINVSSTVESLLIPKYFLC